MLNSANKAGYLAWYSKIVSHLITTHHSTLISIIKQIQASITGEAKWLRWVWSKCNRKAKYIIYMPNHQLPLKPRQITSSPSKQVIWVANIKFWTQKSSDQDTRFLNAKDYTPHEPRQIKTSVKFDQRRQLPLNTSIGHYNNKASQNTYDLVWHPTPKQGWPVLTRIHTSCQHWSINA
jgi:hypothetical protein